MSILRSHRCGTILRIHRLARASALAVAGVMLSWAAAACTPTPSDVLTNPDTGQPISVSDVSAILSNTTTTSERKRQLLLDLGLPEETVTVLLAATGQ
jgi:hypothetical protein